MQLVILAGGGGTRLWPLSTNDRPKQFINVVNDKCLAENMCHILQKKYDKENIWISTNTRYQEILNDLFPELSDKSHIIFEPEKRDSLAALVCSSAVISHQKGENEPILYIPCDDHLEGGDIDLFNIAQQKIADSLNNNEFEIVTVGIKPTFPNTNFGYIEIDTNSLNNTVKTVKSFTEKPDEQTAEKYLQSGNYFWHKCNMSFTFATLKKLLSKHHPDLLEIAEKIEQTGVIDESDYAKFPRVSFEFAIMEKAENIGMVNLDIESWEDIGLWRTVAKFIPEINSDHEIDSREIQVVGDNNKIINTQNRKIAVVGPSNLIVVDSPEGLLILDPEHSSEVKKIAKYFEDKQ